MTKLGDNNPTSSSDFDSFIDQAIDELFVPKKSAEEAKPEAVEEPVAAEAVEPEVEEQDLEISWDQSLSGAPEQDAPEPFSEPPAQTPPVDEDTDFEEGPRAEELQAIHESLLSLDWEVNRANIDAFERHTEELGQKFAANMHMTTTIKMVLIVCKYLRASKSLATPLAITFLRSSMSAFEVFIEGPTATGPSPDALVNKLLGDYNDMKTDANRLRAVALQRREEDLAQAATQGVAAQVRTFATSADDDEGEYEELEPEQAAPVAGQMATQEAVSAIVQSVSGLRALIDSARARVNDAIAGLSGGEQAQQVASQAFAELSEQADALQALVNADGGDVRSDLAQIRSFADGLVRLSIRLEESMEGA